MVIKKSTKMATVEKRLNRTLEEAIPDLINKGGLTVAAEKINVSKATLSYWMLKLGIRYRHVAAPPGLRIALRDPRDGSFTYIDSEDNK